MITKNGILILLKSAIFGKGPRHTQNTDEHLVDVLNRQCCIYSSNSVTLLDQYYLNKIIPYSYYDINDTTSNSTNNSGLFIWIGNGATNLELNSSNYNLGSPINKTYVLPCASKIIYPASGGLRISGNFTNVTNQNININEIGLFAKSYYLVLKSDSNTVCSSILLCRNIIDEVTLLPNETKEFVFDLHTT